MSANPSSDAAIRKVLADLRAGDPSAPDRLAPLVYEELRSMARRLMRNERANHTLQPTALVNEAWLRLRGDHPDRWEDRRCFLAAASVAMRRILVDHARRRGSDKRGGGWERVTLSEVFAGGGRSTEVDVAALSDALDQLARINERQASIVQLRWFGGMTNEEVAAHLGVGITTIKDDWMAARAWLWMKVCPRD